MAKFVGKITDFLGITDHKGERDAVRRSREQTQAAVNTAQSLQLMVNERAREYQDLLEQESSEWTDVFGDITQNVANYYNSLTPGQFATPLIQAQQQAAQKASDSIKRTLAQRGLGGGRFEAGALANVAYQSEVQQANIRSQAPHQVAALQSQFAAQGAQQKQNLQARQAGAAQLGIQGVLSGGQGVVGSQQRGANLESNRAAQIGAKNRKFGGLIGEQVLGVLGSQYEANKGPFPERLLSDSEVAEETKRLQGGA